jgi:hypothetical protein
LRDTARGGVISGDLRLLTDAMLGNVRTRLDGTELMKQISNALDGYHEMKEKGVRDDVWGVFDVF